MENDEYKRLLGELYGLPDVLTTKVATVQTVVPIRGDELLYMVQTYRQKETGDTIFLQCVRQGETIRMALPPAVANAIARQRESLSVRARSATAKRVAQERKDQGIVPFKKKVG